MNCVYCNGKLVKFRSEKTEFLFRDQMFSDELKILSPLLTHGKCTSCGSIIATDVRMESEEKLLEIYRKLPSKYWEQIESLESTHFFSKIEKYINPEKNKMAICDVGCGNGKFLMTLDNCWQKFGVEPSNIANSLLETSGISYFNGNLKDSAFQKHTMDVITYIDVFEHLINPLKEIEIAKEFLSSTGKLVILTGNATSFNSKIAGRAWIYLRIIGHITVASEQGLVNALKTKGFSKIDVFKLSHPSSASFIKWLVYLTASKLTGSKETILGGKRSVPLLHDHMLIIASL
jgi:2-polyprenyl-3-methyl-5-hydroxy-6-metoxy-1,4-benzoquinol methylase